MKLKNKYKKNKPKPPGNLPDKSIQVSRGISADILRASNIAKIRTGKVFGDAVIVFDFESNFV